MAALQYTIGSGMNYASLSAAEAGHRQNLVTAGNTIEFLIQQSFVDSAGEVTFDTGWTTDSTHYITVNVPTTYRHTGVRGTGYRFIPSVADDWTKEIQINKDYTRIIGMAISHTGAGYGTVGIASASANIRIDSCLIYDTSGHGIEWDATGTVVNTTILGAGNHGIRSANAINFYNNTVLHCTNSGFDDSAWFTTVNVTNNYCGGNGTDFRNVDGSGTTTFTTNRSVDGGHATALTLAACHFTSPTAGSENINIASNSGLIGIGTDLHANGSYAFSTDYATDARPNGAWDIGADQYVSSSTTYNVSTTETGTLSDSQSSQGVLVASITETGTLSHIQSSAGPAADRVVTIGPSGRNHLTLVAAFDLVANGGEPDFGATDINIVFVIDAGVYAPFVIPARFITSVDHKIQFRNATGSFHNFTRNTGVIIKYDSDYQSFILTDYTEFYGIAFTQDQTLTHVTAGMVFQNTNQVAWGCFAYDMVGLGYYAYGEWSGGEGLVASDNGNGVINPRFINCAAVGCLGVGIGEQYASDGGTLTIIDNCVSINNKYGFRPMGYSTTNITNCYAGNCSGGGYVTGDAGAEFNAITTCYSDDRTKSTTVLSVSDCSFTNSGVGTEVLTLQAKSKLRYKGTDLHADPDYPFNTDAFGIVRPNGTNQWDIGPQQCILTAFTPIIIFLG